MFGACTTATGHTGCVSKLVLLPFYPVLERLGIAPCDLDLLLDGFLVHVGHATLRLPGVGGLGRGWRRAARQASKPGVCRERDNRQPGHRDADGGGQAQWRASSGGRGAQGRCNCARTVNSGGRRSLGVVGALQRSAGDERGTRAARGWSLASRPSWSGQGAFPHAGTTNNETGNAGCWDEMQGWDWLRGVSCNDVLRWDVCW